MTATRVAVLVSGGGRSLENLVACCRAGLLPDASEAQPDAADADPVAAEVALVVADRAGIGALERATRLGVPALVVHPRDHADADAFGAAVFEAIERAGCELVVLAGFLRLLPIPERWAGRVLNIHPSLLPAFGGKGFWGDRVHRAVLERGCWFSGCTVHYVTDEYDQGPILVQRCVRVAPDDTVASLAAKVFAEECLALPEAVRLHLARSARNAAGPAPEPRVG